VTASREATHSGVTTVYYRLPSSNASKGRTTRASSGASRVSSSSAFTSRSYHSSAPALGRNSCLGVYRCSQIAGSSVFESRVFQHTFTATPRICPEDA
jgi:hypothetical protein